MTTNRNKQRSAEWAQLGSTLGLQAYRALETFNERASFRRSEARLGAQVHSNIKSAHVLRGTRNGRTFALTQFLTMANLAHIFEGDSDGDESGSWWTAVVVPLDPPLNLGLHISKSRPLQSVFQGEDQRLGHEVADKALRVESLDAGKLRSLFAPRTAEDELFLTALAKGGADNLVVTDSKVHFKLPGRVSHAGRLLRFLEAAFWFRDQIEARFPRMIVQPHERANQQVWHQVAASAGLDFDPARMKIHGVLQGIPLEIVGDYSAATVHTAISLRWPRPLNYEVELTKFASDRTDLPLGSTARTLTRALDHLGTTVMVGQQQVATIGDRMFDDTFVIRGTCEAAQALFNPPQLRQNLVAIAASSEAVFLTQHGLSWFVKAPIAGANQLNSHLQMAGQTAQILFPEAKAGYR